jgi:hypothetical protein
VVENYPELKADALYSKMMDDIQEQNENVGAAITIFNRNVELFNNQIEVFPNNLINTLTLSKKAIRPFKDNLATENFDYKPIFKIYFYLNTSQSKLYLDWLFYFLTYATFSSRTTRHNQGK